MSAPVAPITGSKRSATCEGVPRGSHHQPCIGSDGGVWMWSSCWSQCQLRVRLRTHAHEGVSRALVPSRLWSMNIPDRNWRSNSLMKTQTRMTSSEGKSSVTRSVDSPL